MASPSLRLHLITQVVQHQTTKQPVAAFAPLWMCKIWTIAQAHQIPPTLAQEPVKLRMRECIALLIRSAPENETVIRDTLPSERTLPPEPQRFPKNTL